MAGGGGFRRAPRSRGSKNNPSLDRVNRTAHEILTIQIIQELCQLAELYLLVVPAL